MNAIELVWMTCFTGCDYINRLHGFSLQKSIDKVFSWRGKSDQVRMYLKARAWPADTPALTTGLGLATSDTPGLELAASHAARIATAGRRPGNRGVLLLRPAAVGMLGFLA